MKNVYFTAGWIISLVLGIIFCITIVGALLGVPLLMASSKFKAGKDMSDEDLIKNRSNLFGWGIFLAIVLSPTIIGLIVMLILVFMVNKHIEDLEAGNEEEVNKGFGQTVKEGTGKAWAGIKEAFGVKSSLQKDKDKLEELQKMKDEGIITEEEYEAKRKQILGL